jgi:flagellar biosynthesis protein
MERKKAIALKYGNNYDVPTITAAGAGFIAEKIIEKAKEAQVPIVENKEIANLLGNANVGDEIPAELYDAVARIIVYIMDTEKKVKK